MTMTFQAPTGSSQVRPVAFLTIGTHQQVPAPLVQISTCGLLTIEIVEKVVSTDPPLARYRSVAADQLHGRGTTPALTLLKFLLSRPERFASKDWLMHQFCQDRGELFSNVRLDNIASQLRSLLCPPAYADLRTHVVTLVRTGSGSGDGYQLAPHPLIWVDHEALAWHVEQAARMERFSDDPLPDWEHAYKLAKRGSYLPDEIYSDWTTERRGEIAGTLRQSVQALARLYLARHGQAGEEEALLLLRSYWQEHPREEDVLRPLMELLEQRECFQEALEYYERLCQLLEAEKHQPNKQTHDIAAFVRAKQLRRQEHTQIKTLQIVEATNMVGLQPFPQARNGLSHPSYLSMQSSNSALLRDIIERNFPKGITYDLLSSNIKTMNFRDEWQYIVNGLVSEAKTGLRAMVFDVELTRWWNTMAGQIYMLTNLEVLKRKVPIKRIFILSSIDTRLRMNTLMSAYVHHKVGIDVRVCQVSDFQESIPFKPDMFSVHDNLFVTLYYFSTDKPITNLLLDDKYISEFSSFYDELFADDRLCTNIETILAHSHYGPSFWASIQTQLELLQQLKKMGSITDLATRL